MGEPLRSREGASTDHGIAVWSSSEWRDEAISWLDQQLAAAGISRRGDVEQPHLRPWATVLRAQTTRGPVWLKAPGPGTAFETRLYQLLARITPDRVLTPIAVDPARAWIVLPDGGTPLGERLSGTDLAEALVAAVVQYGQLQLDLAPHVDQLLALGVADMRPPVMVERFEQAIDAVAAVLRGHDSAAGRASHREVAAMGPTVASWCEQLAVSSVPASLDHNDLHPWNILLDDGPEDVKFYDWGDSVVAHPFAAMLVPLGFVQRELGATLDDPRFVRARDAYLELFTAAAPAEDLATTLATACRVAKIARVLTWDRALQAAREQGEEIDPFWAAAPLETLASLLDESYLGGA
jgi:Phosphotransferase enzyme family